MLEPTTENKTSGRGISSPIAAGLTLPIRLKEDWFFGLILVLAVIAVYQPVWYAGFIWDDDMHVTANPFIVGPLGLKEIWTTSAGKLFPLVFTTFWVEHALWGLAPLPYHLVNVVQQAVCALLLWRVLRSLLVPGAWLGAILWAVHPVQVESVAWVSELKNTQSGLFYLATIFFYVRWLKMAGNQAGAGRNYALTLLCAALAMASKPSTVVLPVVLALCAWWVEGRWPWRHLVRLAPVALMSLVSTVVTMWPVATDRAAIVDPQWVRSWPERIATTGDVIWFYLGKLLWPHPLIAIYPRWKIDGGLWISYLPLLAVILVSFILWWKRGTWAHPVFFAWAYFLAVLLPFLGLIDQSFWRYSFVQDHLQYLACMGPLALAGAGMSRGVDYLFPRKLWLQTTLGATLLLILGTVSWQRAWVFENEETLWTDALAKNPDCWAGYIDLGLALGKMGRTDEAIAQYQKALAIYPNCAEGHADLAHALVQKGQMDRAISEYQAALEINPQSVETESNLGNALAREGRVDEAIALYEKALEINPNSAETENNLGNARAQKGQLDEAVAQFRKALQINPNFASAHNNLGTALVRMGRGDEAIIEFGKALEIDPQFAAAHNNLGTIFAQKGRMDEAMAQFEEALRLEPDYVPARNNLARAKAMTAQGVPAR